MTEEVFQVSKEFLAQENEEKNQRKMKERGKEKQAQLGQTMPKSEKNGGPYPVQAKKARREEVFKLHFDYGYSARKIADMLKINRNTINSDISFWYSQLYKEDDRITVEDIINKMLYRLETKRTRIMEKMDKTTSSISDFATLEKMLYEVDTKILQVAMKMQTSEKSIFDMVMKMVSSWLEEHGHKERYLLWGDTLKVTPNTKENINRLIDSDRYQKPVDSKDYFSR